uniref:Sugar phosphate transporter domain-containing protein n=1 Tax=Arundo donax TaxID=35708 RepID=A0A0A9BSA9_ARUDO
MGWKDYFMRVVPTALGTALDINLSNASLVFISVTFATMCKSASPIFLLLFAFAFRLESPSIKLLGIIVVISIGVLLTVSKETDFDFWGFIFVTLAAVMSGFRWSMTQILLQVSVLTALVYSFWSCHQSHIFPLFVSLVHSILMICFVCMHVYLDISRKIPMVCTLCLSLSTIL